jgi:hypothetical protein
VPAIGVLLVAPVKRSYLIAVHSPLKGLFPDAGDGFGVSTSAAKSIFFFP